MGIGKALIIGRSVSTLACPKNVACAPPDMSPCDGRVIGEPLRKRNCTSASTVEFARNPCCEATKLPQEPAGDAEKCALDL
jgi:hypothetical protein